MCLAGMRCEVIHSRRGGRMSVEERHGAGSERLFVALACPWRIDWSEHGPVVAIQVRRDQCLDGR